MSLIKAIGTLFKDQSPPPAKIVIELEQPLVRNVPADSAPKANASPARAAVDEKAGMNPEELLAFEEAKLAELQKRRAEIYPRVLQWDQVPKENPALLSLGVSANRDKADVEAVLAGRQLGDHADAGEDPTREYRAVQAAIELQGKKVQSARLATAPSIYRKFEGAHNQAREQIALALTWLADTCKQEEELAARMNQAGAFPSYGPGGGSRNRPFIRFADREALKTLLASIKNLGVKELLS